MVCLQVSFHPAKYKTRACNGVALRESSSMRVLNSLKDNFVSRCFKCIFKVLIVVEKEHVVLLTATAS